MRGEFSVCIIAMLVMGVLISGCTNAPLGKTQVADFGTTADAQKAQEWFTNAYGNPATYSGGPRILEPMVSDTLLSNIPTDKISKLSQETSTVYFWAIYEGYTSGDTINAVWMYNGQQYAVLSKIVGGNYGIVSGQFDKPQKGWALGTHSIVISGKGAQNSTTFEIISGPSQVVSLPYSGTSSENQGPGTTTSQQCSGPTCPGTSGTCKEGFVYREAGSSDKVCVPPASHTQALADNAAAGSRLATASYGADMCAQGYVWREAFTGDHVCVLPAVRSQAAADNAAAKSRLATATYGADTCAQGYVWREAFTGDHVCVTPEIHATTLNENTLASSRTWP